jgi:hypothetical protein
MNINHQAWWTMIRYMKISTVDSWLRIQYTNPRPCLFNFAEWISQHIWYIFRQPPTHLRYQRHTYAIPLTDPRFVLLFAGDSPKGLTNILYSTTWTFFRFSRVSGICPHSNTTTMNASFFSTLTDENKICSAIFFLIVVDPIHNPSS